MLMVNELQAEKLQRYSTPETDLEGPYWMPRRKVSFDWIIDVTYRNWTEVCMVPNEVLKESFSEGS